MKILLSVLVALLLTSCGEDENANFFSASKGTVTATQATSIVALSGQTSPTAAVAVNPTAVGSAAPTVTTRGNFDTCITRTPETTTDADGDGIPLTEKLSFACSDIEGTNSTLTQNGSRTVTDKDDADIAGGYRYEYALTGGSTASSGFSSSYDYSGHFDFTRSAGTADTRANGTWSYTSNFRGINSGGGGGHPDYSTTWGQAFTSTYTQTAREGRDFTGSGTATISGFWGYKGLLSQEAVDFVFSVASENLTWDSSCNGFFTGGSLTYTDAGSNIIKYTYSACGTVATTFNGTATTRN